MSIYIYIYIKNMLDLDMTRYMSYWIRIKKRDNEIEIKLDE